MILNWLAIFLIGFITLATIFHILVMHFSKDHYRKIGEHYKGTEYGKQFFNEDESTKS